MQTKWPGIKKGGVIKSTRPAKKLAELRKHMLAAAAAAEEIPQALPVPQITLPSSNEPVPLSDSE